MPLRASRQAAVTESNRKPRCFDRRRLPMPCGSRMVWHQTRLPLTGAISADYPVWLIPRGTTLASAREADLAQYFADKHATTLASTANRRLAVLRRFYRWAMREGRVAQDPTLRLKGARKPPALSQVALRRSGRGAAARSRYDTRSDSVIAQCWNSYMRPGLRVSELVGMHFAATVAYRRLGARARQGRQRAHRSARRRSAQLGSSAI